MDEEEKLSWTALEYEEKEKSTDWFWALGVVIIASAITAIIYNNYFFAVVILLSGTLLGIFAKKKPALISYELNGRGVRIGENFYPYEGIKAFYVQNHDREKGHKPTLFLKSERIFMPILSIPIENEWTEGIKEILLEKNIQEKEMREHMSEKIMESLGF